MSDPSKLKRKEAPQGMKLIEESVVFGIKDEIIKMKTESQIFQDQVEQYEKKTGMLAADTNFLGIGKTLRNEYFHLLDKIVGVVQTVNDKVT